MRVIIGLGASRAGTKIRMELKAVRRILSKLELHVMREKLLRGTYGIRCLVTEFFYQLVSRPGQKKWCWKTEKMSGRAAELYDGTEGTILICLYSVACRPAGVSWHGLRALDRVYLGPPKPDPQKHRTRAGIGQKFCRAVNRRGTAGR